MTARLVWENIVAALTVAGGGLLVAFLAFSLGLGMAEVGRMLLTAAGVI